MYLSTCRLLLATVVFWLALAAPVGAQQPQPPPVTCRSCLLIDDTGRVIAQRNPEERLPNASTTKMVTAILALPHAAASETVRISPTAASVGQAGVDLEAGERWNAGQLLYALLLTSSNEAAVALAEHHSGSEAAFVEEMNRYVDSIGADDTHFVTSHGLDQPNHFSTATDLALIAEELLAEPTLARIVKTPRVTVHGELMENRNLLLETYRGAIGVKTGQTDAAGFVLVAAAERGGRRLISVVMNSVDSFADSKALLNHGFAVLRRTVVIAKGAPAGEIVIDDAGTLSLVTGRAVRGLFREEELKPVVDLGANVEPPIEAGERVGTVVYMKDGKRVARVPVLAGAPLAARPEPLDEESRPLLLIAVVAVVLVGTVVIVRARR